MVCSTDRDRVGENIEINKKSTNKCKTKYSHVLKASRICVKYDYNSVQKSQKREILLCLWNSNKIKTYVTIK